MDIVSEFVTEEQQLNGVKPLTHEQRIDGAPAMLQRIVQMRSRGGGDSDVQTKVSGLRHRAVKDTALALGAQSGLHYRNQQIKAILAKDDTLDIRYNFAPFVEQDKVLVPVITRSRAVESFNGDSITTAKVQYRIHTPAKLIMSPPTYRSYLIQDYRLPEDPRDVLKPRSKEEVAIWTAAAVQGWELGIRQANSMFENQLAKLDRDIEGRLLYLKMRELGMINKAALRVTKNGVTFNGNTMNVGQVVYDLSEDANYLSIDEWETAITE